MLIAQENVAEKAALSQHQLQLKMMLGEHENVQIFRLEEQFLRLVIHG